MLRAATVAACMVKLARLKGAESAFIPFDAGPVNAPLLR